MEKYDVNQPVVLKRGVYHTLVDTILNLIFERG